MGNNCPRCGKAFEVERSSGAVRCPACGAAQATEAFGETQALSPEEARAAASGPERVEPARPARFAHYQIIDELGRGAMGVVYKAFDPELKRTVALKVLLAAEHASKEEIERFFREASSAASLQHPNIVPIHELKVHEGKHYYTMDLIEGEPLDKLIKAKKLNVRQSLELLEKVAKALHHAHSKGIVHRDLKPANIIVGADGEPKVTDFGLAKVLTSDEKAVTAAGLTGSGVAMGTPYYEAPEQAMGRSREVDARSDVYSLGCIMYELLVGAPPFVDASQLEILRKHVEQDPIPPSRRGATVSADVETICLKCLEKEPARRYQTAKELAADLRRFLDGEPISARPASILYVTRKKLLRHRVVASVIAVAGVILIALTIGYIVSLREQIAARERLEKEKQAKLEADQREADKASQAGREALRKAGAAQLPAERENLLIEAQGAFRKALFLVPGAEAGKGMCEASLGHFDLALESNNFRQAREKLEQARQVGLAEAEYKEKDKRLREAETAREKHIKERVEYLMADAQKTKRETPHEMASLELISLKDPVITKLLLPYVKDKSQWCQMLAMEALAWMGDPGVAKEMVPYIQEKRPDGTENPEAVQEAAIRAVCILAPTDLSIYETLRGVCSDRAGKKEGLVANQMKHYFRRYAAQMAPRSEVVIDTNITDKNRLAWAWHTQGVRYMEAELFRKAVESFDKALAIAPDNAQYYSDRGAAKLMARDLDGALQDQTKAVELAPGLAAGYSRRAGTYSEKGDWRRAIKDYDEALRLSPDLHEVYYNRAVTKVEMYDYEGALKDFNNLLALNPRDEKALVGVGGVKSAMGDLDGATRSYEMALELNPKSSGAFFGRAQVRLLRKDHKGAFRDLDKAIELNPGISAAYFNRGFLKNHLGDPCGAIVDITKGLELAPDSFWGYHNRSVAMVQCGDFAGAVCDAEQAIKLKPEYAYPLLIKAVACHALGRDAEFRAALDQFKKKQPNPAAAEDTVMQMCRQARIIQLGKSLEGRDLTQASDLIARGQYRTVVARLGEARSDFEAALKASSEGGQEGTFRSLAEVVGKQEDWPAKLEIHRRWATALPESPEALNGCAWELLTSNDEKLRDAKKALPLARKAAELTKNANPAILDSLALALFENGQVEEAVKTQEKALSLLPPNVPAPQRKEFEDKLGRYKKALEGQREKRP